MFASLRLRLALALFALLLLGAGAAVVVGALRSQSAGELLEETSLSSQAAALSKSLRFDAAGRPRVVEAPGGWAEAYRSPDGAYFTLYATDGREAARSPNLRRPLTPLPVPPGATQSRLALTGSSQVLTQTFSVGDGALLVVGRENPGMRREAGGDRLFDMLPVLLVAGLLSAALAIVAGVTAWSLRPLRRAVQEASQIGPSRPEARLSLTGVPSELRPMGLAVNAALDRVAAAYEAEKRFTADSAHALRTPLTVLDLRLQKLEAGERIEPSRLRRDVDEITRLVTSLLRLAQRDASTSTTPGSVNLGRIVREAAAEASDLLAAQGRRIEVATPETATICGEAGLWRDVVLTLLDNAQVHGLGVVAVELSHDGGEVVLRVADQGAGVPASYRERVFERFHKLDGSTRGAGLGLAIVRQAAHQHGGRVVFLDRAVVELRLPGA